MIAMANDCLNRIRRTRLEKRMKEIMLEMKGASADAEKQKALISEAQEISGRLRKLKSPTNPGS